MSVLSLSPQTLKVERSEETVGTDGKPEIVTTTYVTSALCRLDRGYTKIFSSTLQGDMRANQLAGTLFIDADVKDDEGNPLELQLKDKVEIEGHFYEIINILPMRGYRDIDHYEIAVVDYENK